MSAHSPHVFLQTHNRLTSGMVHGVTQFEDFASHYIMQYYLNKFNITTQTTADVQDKQKQTQKGNVSSYFNCTHKHYELNELHVHKSYLVILLTSTYQPIGTQRIPLVDPHMYPR